MIHCGNEDAELAGPNPGAAVDSEQTSRAPTSEPVFGSLPFPSTVRLKQPLLAPGAPLCCPQWSSGPTTPTPRRQRPAMRYPQPPADRSRVESPFFVALRVILSRSTKYASASQSAWVAAVCHSGGFGPHSGLCACRRPWARSSVGVTPLVPFLLIPTRRTTSEPPISFRPSRCTSRHR